MLKGTEKIWDSSIPNIGILWVVQQQRSALPAYFDAVYPPFWRRELDIENAEVIAQEITVAGADGTQFEGYLNTEGRKRLSDLHSEAEAAGVFGVPSYLVGEALFWGAERAERVYELLKGR